MKTTKKITICDIADKLSISPSTVSRAFHPKERSRISNETRQRIYRTAKRMGYQPNRIARALSRGGTDTIGVIVPYSLHLSQSHYYSSVITESVVALDETAFDVKVHVLHDDDEIPALSDLLMTLAVDGIVLVGMSDSMHIPADDRKNIPAIMLNCYHDDAFPSIDADNIQGGRLAAQYFIERGHTRTGMLAGPKDTVNARDRLRGFKNELKNNGIELPKEWCIHSDFSEAEGYQSMHRILGKDSYPSAVFCANDELAAGALRAISEYELQCPQDISLIGFDNAPFTQYTVPRLTTIAQPVRTMVRAVIDHLVTAIKTPQPAIRIAFPVHIIERESTATYSPAE